MFRAILCSSSGGQNCIFTASGIVTFCERPYSAPVESGLQSAQLNVRCWCLYYYYYYYYYYYERETLSLVLREGHKGECSRIECWRYVGLSGTKLRGNGEDCMTRSLMIYTAHQILFGWSNTKNDLDGACSTYGEQESCVQGFGGETWGKETTWMTQA
jgi:hypothetical protein